MGYKIGKSLQESIDKRNLRDIKVDLTSIMLQHENNRDYIMYCINYVRKHYGEIYEPDDGEDETSEEYMKENNHKKITRGLLSEIRTDLTYNFSRERVERAISVAEQLFGKYDPAKDKYRESIIDNKKDKPKDIDLVKNTLNNLINNRILKK